jgi:hypothetical protein
MLVSWVLVLFGLGDLALSFLGNFVNSSKYQHSPTPPSVTLPLPEAFNLQYLLG